MFFGCFGFIKTYAPTITGLAIFQANHPFWPYRFAQSFLADCQY